MEGSFGKTGPGSRLRSTARERGLALTPVSFCRSEQVALPARGSGLRRWSLLRGAGHAAGFHQVLSEVRETLQVDDALLGGLGPSKRRQVFYFVDFRERLDVARAAGAGGRLRARLGAFGDTADASFAGGDDAEFGELGFGGARNGVAIRFIA